MFDVKKHLIKVQGGRQYLPVAARLVWFRQEHPDWGIETRAVTIDTERQYAVFEARVYDTDGKLMATGTKMENVKGFPDFIEKAETGSIGRALAVCGYGTQFAPDLDETQGHNPRVVDSPQGGRNGSYSQARYGEGPSDAALACQAEGCGRAINKAQHDLSVRKYGIALCPDCQKGRRAVEV